MTKYFKNISLKSMAIKALAGCLLAFACMVGYFHAFGKQKEVTSKGWFSSTTTVEQRKLTDSLNEAVGALKSATEKVANSVVKKPEVYRPQTRKEWLIENWKAIGATTLGVIVVIYLTYRYGFSYAKSFFARTKAVQTKLLDDQQL